MKQALLTAPIPKKILAEMNDSPEYARCALSEYHQCEGRITREHAVYYQGKRIQARWAIIPLCAKYHSVDQFQDNGLLNKSMNRWIALNRATEEELESYERANFVRERDILNGRFGLPKLWKRSNITE